jgi:hypothetical protein
MLVFAKMSVLDFVLRYFDLRPGAELAHLRALGKPDAPWLLQYVALVLGVVVQPYLQQFQATGQWQPDGIWGRIVPAALIGLAVLPAVYCRAFDPHTPGFVQFCIIFVSGMGWESLMPAIAKAVHPSH